MFRERHDLFRDETVDISLGIIAVYLFVKLIWYPDSLFSFSDFHYDPNLLRMLELITALAALRIVVLWFQTAIHAARHHRVGVVLFHLLFPVLPSIVYYYVHRAPIPTARYF